MNNDIEQQKCIDNLISALKSADNEKIEKAAYDLFNEATNMIEVISFFLFLDNLKINMNLGTSKISKGTRLFRIRSFDNNINFSDEKQWTAPPHKPQNRANKSGQKALYLGSTETICILETQISKGEQYILGEYICLEDIYLGGFLSYKQDNHTHNIMCAILNACLIAPDRGDKNISLFSYLDKKYGKITINDLKINDLKGLELPLKFAVLNGREEYYNTTNLLCEILEKKTPCGIKYSSCYIPVETSGISCTDYNVVLYTNGISKINFLGSKTKTNILNFNGEDILKTIIEGETNDDRKI